MEHRVRSESRTHPTYTPSLLTSSTNPTDGQQAPSRLPGRKKFRVHGLVGPEEGELDLERSCKRREARVASIPLRGWRSGRPQKEKGGGPGEGAHGGGPLAWSLLSLWRDTLEYGDPLRGSNPTGRDATETPSDRCSRI